VQFFGEGDVVAGLGDDGDIFEVFGGGADHGGAADVDVFNEMAKGNVGLGCRLFEGVEVDYDHVDGQDAVLGYGSFVLSFAADVEQAAVDAGVEGFDAAVEHFREAGELADVLNLQAGFTEGARGAAGRDELYAEGGQELGEGDQAGFVGDAEEGAADGLEASREGRVGDRGQRVSSLGPGDLYGCRRVLPPFCRVATLRGQEHFSGYIGRGAGKEAQCNFTQSTTSGSIAFLAFDCQPCGSQLE
jgi:hypothetical protein